MSHMDMGKMRTENSGLVRKAILEVIPDLSYDDELDDLEQDVWLKATASAGTYDPSKSKATTWLYTVAQSVAKNHLRHRAAQPELVYAGGLYSEDEDGYSVPYYDQLGSDMDTPDLLAEAAQGMVLECHGLTRAERRVFDLVWKRGYSIQEASDQIGTSYTVVSTLVSRIKAKYIC